MKKYLLMLSAAALVAAAPAYYAIQSAQADAEVVKSQATVETPAAKTTAEATIDCAAIAKGAETPAPCIESAAGTAKSAAVKGSVKNTPAVRSGKVVEKTDVSASTAPAMKINE